jgi:membrane-bound lytic murein transglycosylase B
MNKRQTLLIFLLPVIFSAGLLLTSCTEEGEVISKPDEFKHVYEANENKLLQAIAQVFKDKGFGTAEINQETNQVESGYLIQDDWRTKGIARVKKINWKECELVLSVITEKNISNGWEMRRLLGKSQYDTFFNAIELQLYQEMYKVK